MLFVYSERETLCHLTGFNDVVSVSQTCQQVELVFRTYHNVNSCV